MTEVRRILLDGYPTVVTRDGDSLLARDGRRVAIDVAVHLPPVEPTKIICCHLNHVSRVVEFGVSLPPAPTYFHKPISALNAHNSAVVRPSNCHWLNYEGEVAIVIGRTCRNIRHAEAGDYIAGYTVANDFGLHDFRDTDSGSMLRVKGADTLLPIGPGIVRGVNLFEQTLRTYVNGLVVQEAHIGDETIWGPHYVVADIARHITLVPGDVILMGTPCHSRSVDAGQVVECEVTGLGRVAGTVVAVPAPRAAALGVGHAPTDSPEVRRVACGFDERVPEHLKANYRQAAKK